MPQAQRPKKLRDQMRDVLHTHPASVRTAEASVEGARRLMLWHQTRHPHEMGRAERAALLTPLARERHVAASTQQQALSALRVSPRPSCTTRSRRWTLSARGSPHACPRSSPHPPHAACGMPWWVCRHGWRSGSLAAACGPLRVGACGSKRWIVRRLGSSSAMAKAQKIGAPGGPRTLWHLSRSIWHGRHRCTPPSSGRATAQGIAPRHWSAPFPMPTVRGAGKTCCQPHAARWTPARVPSVALTWMKAVCSKPCAPLHAWPGSTHPSPVIPSATPVLRIDGKPDTLCAPYRHCSGIKTSRLP